MSTSNGEKIEVIDAHSHMGERKKLSIYQVPAIMKFMAEGMIKDMDEPVVDKVVTFAIGIMLLSDFSLI